MTSYLFVLLVGVCHVYCAPTDLLEAELQRDRLELTDILNRLRTFVDTRQAITTTAPTEAPQINAQDYQQAKNLERELNILLETRMLEERVRMLEARDGLLSGQDVPESPVNPSNPPDNQETTTQVPVISDVNDLEHRATDGQLGSENFAEQNIVEHPTPPQEHRELEDGDGDATADTRIMNVMEELMALLEARTQELEMRQRSVTHGPLEARKRTRPPVLPNIVSRDVGSAGDEHQRSLMALAALLHDNRQE